MNYFKQSNICLVYVCLQCHTNPGHRLSLKASCRSSSSAEPTFLNLFSSISLNNTSHFTGESTTNQIYSSVVCLLTCPYSTSRFVGQSSGFNRNSFSTPPPLKPIVVVVCDCKNATPPGLRQLLKAQSLICPSASLAPSIYAIRHKGLHHPQSFYDD